MSPHLNEDVLVECYVARHTGDPVDPPVAEHLADCSACGARYADMADVMDDLRIDADVETDRLFPSDRTAAQRDQIARRLEQLGHAARVINFPGSTATRHSSGSRSAPRWVAAAAAAGLFVGVAVGTLYSPDAQLESVQTSARGPRPSTPPRTVAVPAETAEIPPTPIDDDEFLSELEFALGGPRSRVLMPYDALTPSVREVRVAQIR